MRRLAKKYDKSFLLCLSGFGDADMMNYFDEEGNRITPACASKEPVGPKILGALKHLGAKTFIPSSSQHEYQREDSDWANAYTTALTDHAVGFESHTHNMLPSFIHYDCETDDYSQINPKKVPHIVYPASAFGDNWSDVLEKKDVESARKYFQAVEHLRDNMAYINLRVGGVDNTIDISKHPLKRGITFEAPRASLMTSIQYEVFEDMLIGNYMKATLHGPWPHTSLHPYLPECLCKFADNGRAKTRREVKQYIETYCKRNFGLRVKRSHDWIKESVRGVTGENTPAFRVLKSVYQMIRTRRIWT